MKAPATTADPSERFIELFDRVRQIEPASRRHFLEETCAAEPQWREELESLLAYDDDSPVLNATSALKAVARTLAEDDLSGKEIGHYHIIQPLGAGGMGRVYLAEDRTLARRVALKFLPESFTAEPQRIRRFEQEARAASALNHPNIITVYETGQHEGRHYIAYELVEGQTLRARLSDESLGEPLRWQEAVVIGAQIAAALKAAHAAGIIHRDIKPENVMLRADGLVKVLDFGIAKRLEMQLAEASTEDTMTVSATLAGQVFGTVGYLAPEQARGEKLDARADIFALGMVLYEMLAGHPWQGLLPAEKLEAVQSADDLPSLGQRHRNLPMALPMSLVDMVGRATRKERDARQVTAEQMHATLEELRLPLEVRSAERNQELARQLAQERANQSLNQAVALYASDATTRLSLTEWWTIQRRSNAPRGKLERMLLRRSLFSVLAKGCAVAGLAALLAFVLAAWVSVTERFTAERFLREGHDNIVRQFALSPDGKLLVSVGSDAKIIVWDFASRARLATLMHDGQQDVTAVTFAPDGRWFATACRDGTVNVWDAKSYSKQAVVGGYKGSARQVTFSPNGRWLMTVTGEQKTTLWETEGWKKIRELNIPGFGGNGGTIFSPDSRFLMSSTWMILDVAKGVPLTSEQPSMSWMSWMASSPDTTQFVSVDTGGFVYFWDVHQFWVTGQRKLLKRERAHQDRARITVYSPDGRYVATGGETTILWNAQVQAKLARFPYFERPTHLAFTPDSQSLIASYGDAQILTWDIAARAQQASFVGHSHPVRSVAYAPNGKMIASAGDDQSIILWDMVSGRKQMVLSAHRTRITALEFSSDSQQLTSTDLHGETIVWEVATGRVQLRFAIPGLLESRFGYAVSRSPNQQCIATSFGVHASADGRVVADFGNKNGPPGPDTQEFYAVRFSPDGRWLVGVSPGNRVFLWDTTNWTVRERASTNQGGTAGLISLAISPDSRWIVTGQDQGQIRLWSIEPLREVAVIGEHKSYVRAVAFSHDGRFVASASDDKTVKLWDVVRRKLVEEIGIHTSPVLAVAFSPDDKQLVTGEYDNSVRVYTQQRSLWGWQLD